MSKSSTAMKLVVSVPRAVATGSKRKPQRKKGVSDVPNGPYLDVDAVLRRSEPDHVGKK